MSEKFARISGPELEALVEDPSKQDTYILIDVRPVEMYEERHISVAENIPLAQLEEKVEYLRDKSAGKKLILICAKGKTSVKAANLLAEHGFDNLYSAEGQAVYTYRDI